MARREKVQSKLLVWCWSHDYQCYLQAGEAFQMLQQL
jgi:hypothetical protein